MPKENTQNRWFSIEATNAKSTHADIRLYGIVGSWRVNIQRFREELSQYKNLKTIKLFVSTLGGTFLDGLPIYNELKMHKAHVTTVNMGYAVSMGSHIMLAGDNIQMAQNAMFMIHSPNVFMWDQCNARDLRKQAVALDKHEKAMLPRYRERMDISDAEITKLLHEETWYTAEEALAAGLIDEIIDAIDLDEAEEDLTEDHWREVVSQIRNKPPESFLNRLSLHIPEATALFANKQKPAPTPEAEDDTMTPEQEAKFEKLINEGIAKAAKDAATQATANLDTVVEAAVTKAMPTTEQKEADVKAQADATAKISTAIEGVDTKLTEASTKLGEIAIAQTEQGTALTETKELVEGVKKLPVNKPRVTDTTDGDEPSKTPAKRYT